jgi:HK97 family phage prohead protease
MPVQRFIQTKSIAVNVKDIDTSQRIVKGYFASFGTLDSDGDVFQKGAFAKSIAENGPASARARIKHLYNHWDAVGVLKELQEDESGLFFVSQLGRHTLGEDTLKMYEDEIITEHSVGFQTISEQKQQGGNYITEAKLWEGSSLDKWGANMNTPVIKSADAAHYMLKRMAKLEKALRDGTYTDETMNSLEIQLKYIQQYISEITLAGHQAPPAPRDKEKALNIINLIIHNKKN